LRQSEIEYLRDSSLGEKNVGRLDVAMRNAFGMCGLERLGDLDPEPDQFFDANGPLGDPVVPTR
jgi:hypothetical protein